MSVALCSKFSNFFLKTNFLDRSFLEIPFTDRDSFISALFLLKRNLKSTCSRIVTLATVANTNVHRRQEIRYQLQKPAHVPLFCWILCFYLVMRFEICESALTRPIKQYHGKLDVLQSDASGEFQVMSPWQVIPT